MAEKNDQNIAPENKQEEPMMDFDAAGFMERFMPRQWINKSKEFLDKHIGGEMLDNVMGGKMEEKDREQEPTPEPKLRGDDFLDKIIGTWDRFSPSSSKDMDNDMGMER